MAFEPTRSIADIMLAHADMWKPAETGSAFVNAYNAAQANKQRREGLEQSQQGIDQRQQQIDQDAEKLRREQTREDMVGIAAQLDNAQTPEEAENIWNTEVGAFRRRTGGGEVPPYSIEGHRAFVAKAQAIMGQGGSNNVQSTFIDDDGFVNIIRRNGEIVNTKKTAGQNMALVDDGAGGKMLVSRFGSRAGQMPQTVVPTGTAIDNAANRAGAVEGATQAAQNSPEAIDARARSAATVDATQQAIAQSGEALTSLGKVRTSLRNVDDAIAAIDGGARVGAVVSKLPSITQASVELDNVRGRMGLDVIGATTFGALSESELKFALDTALPTNLSGPALREWLVAKKKAQQKLGAELEGAAIFLGTPGNTPAMYMQLLRDAGALEFERGATGSAADLSDDELKKKLGL